MAHMSARGTKDMHMDAEFVTITMRRAWIQRAAALFHQYECVRNSM